MTSLIPTVIALSEFFAKNFPDISWYPYWYLGNPYHYLIGPVVPIILGVIRVIGEIGGVGVPLEGAYLSLIFASFLLGGLGIFLLLRDWGAQMRAAILSGILYIVLPAGFYLLFYQNGLNHVAVGLLPYILLYFRRFLLPGNKSPRLLVLLMLLMITIILLINISTFLPLIIDLIALFVSLEKKEKVEEKIGKTVLIILLSLSLSTLWYTPKFWWILTTNPSLGGVPLGKLVWSILQFLLQFLPLVLGIFIVKLGKYKIRGYLLFGLFFFASFLFLSVVRFVSDPDFVIDWIGFGLELQFGLSILLGHFVFHQRENVEGVVQSSKFKMQNYSSKFKIDRMLSFRAQARNPLGISHFVGDGISCHFALLIFLAILSSIIFDVWLLGRLANQSGNGYQSKIIEMLKKHIGEDERIFLSGSSVFFINSKFNIQQVRGGVDQSSIHPFWAMAAYQIREGESGSLAYDWLKALGVSYILVHDRYSDEPFRDFKYPLKFADKSLGFKLINVKEGDRLYKVKDASIGRVADTSILDVRKPRNGLDQQSINKYTLSFKRPLAVNYKKPNLIAIEGDIKQGEIISLAISYDSLWDIVYGKGTIAADPLGNTVIIPEKTGLQRFELVYKRGLLDMAIPLIFSIVILVIIAKFDRITSYIKKRLPKLSIGLKDDDY